MCPVPIVAPPHTWKEELPPEWPPTGTLISLEFLEGRSDPHTRSLDFPRRSEASKSEVIWARAGACGLSNIQPL